MIDVESLKKGLMTDLSDAQDQVNKTQRNIGVEEPSDFAPRAFRSKDLILGQAELKKLHKAISKASDDLIYESGITDELEQAKFKTDFTKKMNQIKLILLRSAGEAELYSKKKALDQAEQQALWKAIGGAASGIGELVISGIGSGKNADGGFSGNFSRGGGGGDRFSLNAFPTTPLGKPNFFED